MTPASLRMGTRGSALARTQSGAVARALTEAMGVAVEIVLVRTTGDELSSEGKAPPGGDQTGVFTRALDDALREGRIDFAVHSLKDLPTTPEPGVFLAAVPLRADGRDALVLPALAGESGSLKGLPERARVATSSPRRIAQLLRLRSDLIPIGMAGNVDSRLRKLEKGEADALLLACAGLDRLSLGSRIAYRVDPREIQPAPGQGALALVCRAGDEATRLLLARLDHLPSRWATAAERSLLNVLGAGCRAPVGAFAEFDGASLCLTGRVLSLDGRESVESSGSTLGTGDEAAEELGRRIGTALIRSGAAALVEAARRDS